MAQHARHLGQGAQVLGAGVFRGQQGENQVDRQVIDSVVGDRAFQADEDAVHAVKTRQGRVRHGDTQTHAGRAQLLAFHQRLQDIVGVQLELARRDIGNRL